MVALNVEKKEPEGFKGKMIAKIRLPMAINVNIFLSLLFLNLL
jgi:hypothetical protein